MPAGEQLARSLYTARAYAAFQKSMACLSNKQLCMALMHNTRLPPAYWCAHSLLSCATQLFILQQWLSVKAFTMKVSGRDTLEVSMTDTFTLSHCCKYNNTKNCRPSDSLP